MPSPVPGAITLEKKTVQAMVEIYCADLHHVPGGGLCADCRSLLSYSHDRLDRCPYGEEKPTCKECPVHCYRPDPREAMRVVMRHAGPRGSKQALALFAVTLLVCIGEHESSQTVDGRYGGGRDNGATASKLADTVR